MTVLLAPFISCLLMGVVSSLHPCPLSANSAALSMLSGIPNSKNLFGILILFISGYLLSLTSIALIVNLGIQSIPRLSVLLQNGVPLFLGPILILVGMIFTGMLKLDRFYISPLHQSIIKKHSVIYAFIGGVIFGLALCPATASVYFGAMIPLSIRYEQPFLFPLTYAFGAVLPIIATGYLLRRGLEHLLSQQRINSFKKITGYLIIVIGIYYSINNLYLP